MIAKVLLELIDPVGALLILLLRAEKHCSVSTSLQACHKNMKLDMQEQYQKLMLHISS